MVRFVATVIALFCALLAMWWESEERQKQVQVLNNLARSCQVGRVRVNCSMEKVRSLFDAISGSGASVDLRQQAARYHAAYEATFSDLAPVNAPAAAAAGENKA